jgi:ABC-type multidrug transport system fused ATPase/permease subunit
VFAGDMMDLDLTLPRIFRWWQMTVSVTLVALIPAMVVVPMVVPLVCVLILLCVGIYRLYGDVQIEISRLYLMSIGPILSSFSSYVSGLDTIRAFNRVGAFNKKFDIAISGFMNVSYWQAAMDATSQWIVGGPLSSLLFMLPLAIFLVTYDVSPEIAALLLMYGASFSFRLPRGLFMTVRNCSRSITHFAINHKSNTNRCKSRNQWYALKDL